MRVTDEPVVIDGVEYQDVVMIHHTGTLTDEEKDAIRYVILESRKEGREVTSILYDSGNV